MSKTYSVAEAAARLGCSVDTVRRRAQAGELETQPLQKGYAVVLADVEPALLAIDEVRAERDRLLSQLSFLEARLVQALEGQEDLRQIISTLVSRTHS